MATVPRKPAGEGSDFDPSELLAAHGEHDKTITNLTERMAKVEGRLDTPQALAAYFQESAKDSRVLEGVFADMFCRFIKENDAVKAAVDKRMEEVDRKFFHKFLKRAWWVVYTIGVVILTLAVDVFRSWLEATFIHKP